MSFKVIEDHWTEEFMYFLIDEGCIQYAFKDLELAEEFKRKGMLNYMLLTDLNNITHDTMLDPNELRSWLNKIQRCIVSR